MGACSPGAGASADGTSATGSAAAVGDVSGGAETCSAVGAWAGETCGGVIGAGVAGTGCTITAGCASPGEAGVTEPLAASAGDCAAASEEPDPSPMITRGVPTSTVSSSATRMASITPAIGDGISVSTLSVETSSSGSSTSTRSPTFFNQRVTVPSVTLSPSAGRLTDSLISDAP